MPQASTLGMAVLLFQFLSFCQIHAQKNQPLDDPPIQKIDGIEYEVLPGLAEVLSIKQLKGKDSSALGYDEYQVLFRFVPMEGQELLEILKEKPLEFNLTYRGFALPVGPAYLKKMQLREGRRYAMELFQSRSRAINIRRFFYQSKALEKDLFQAYDDVVDGLILIIDLFGEDSIPVLKNDATLSDAQKRILIDVEYKYNRGEFVEIILNRHVVDYLMTHNQLLEEYEAAKALFAKMAEEQRLKERLEEAAKAKEDSIRAHKIQALGNENIPVLAEEPRIIRGCYYEVVMPGLAEITEINLIKKAKESARNHDEYQVLFKFLPQEGHILLDEFKHAQLEFVLYYRGERLHVGPKYLKKKQVKVGNQFQMTFFQKRDAEVCSEQYTFESKGLDNDLFEAFPPKPFFETMKDSLTTQDGNLGEDKADDGSKEEGEKIDADLAYAEALKELNEAILERKKWRIASHEAVRIARIKARRAKKLKRLANTSK